MIKINIPNLLSGQYGIVLSTSYRYSPKIQELFLAFMEFQEFSWWRIKEHHGEGGGRERLLASCHVFSV